MNRKNLLLNFENIIMAKLKIITNFNSSFTLEKAAKEILFQLLKSETFLQQIAEQGKCEKIEFTELVFQPIPYSEQTPKGMPPEFEEYYQSEDYLIVNVPPNFMFNAKIFNPSRLCAVYKKVL